MQVTPLPMAKLKPSTKSRIVLLPVIYARGVKSFVRDNVNGGFVRFRPPEKPSPRTSGVC